MKKLTFTLEHPVITEDGTEAEQEQLATVVVELQMYV
jgi:hypothetical protein